MTDGSETVAARGGRVRTFLTLAAFISVNCGGGGGGGTPPTAPSVPGAQPPAVNVGYKPTLNVAGWIGGASTDQASDATGFGLTVQQTGAQVTGEISSTAWGGGSLGRTGPFSGTVSGNTIIFNFSFGNSGTGCGNAISGTAIVNSVNTDTDPYTMNTMTATFSGHDCNGGPVTNGRFTAGYSQPSFSATRFPVAGTWNGALPTTLGGGTWTWRLAQDGDVNGGNLTGSVTFENGNTLNAGTGTVTGKVTNGFPGGPEAVSAATTITFGTCAGSLTATWRMNLGGRGLFMTDVSGSVCNVPIGLGSERSLNRQ